MLGLLGLMSWLLTSKKVLDKLAEMPYNNRMEKINKRKITMYTDAIVAEMHEIASFNYESAAAFAAKHGLSTRSVISKAKYEQLPYEPKEVVAKGPRVRKSDLVAEIASGLGVPFETIEGLAKADMASIRALQAAI